MQKYDDVFTPNFKRDYKLAQKRGYEIGLLKEIVTKLANGEELPERNRDHALTGTHSDLF